MEQVRTYAVLKLRRAGHSNNAIIKLLKCPKSTVYDVVKRFKDTGKVKRSGHSPRSDKIRTPRYLASLKRSTNSNWGKSMSMLAMERNVSKSTISRAVKDLGYKTYALSVEHILTKTQSPPTRPLS